MKKMLMLPTMLFSTICSFVLVISSVRAQTNYDATTEFGSTNPNGVWSYGYTETSDPASTLIYFDSYNTSTELLSWTSSTVTDAVGIYRNVSGSAIAGLPGNMICLHPGPEGQNAVLQFTAPSLGYYDFSVRFFDGSTGETDARILLDRNALSPLFYAAQTSTNPTYTNTLRLAPGQTVEIVVGSLGAHGGDVTPLEASISYSTTPPDTDGDGLSDEWEQGIGRYRVIYGNFDWIAARDDATSRGGYLATITSQAEQEFIVTTFENEIRDDTGGSWGTWIGAYQTSNADEPSGNWAWVTGEQWLYTNWNGGPDNYLGNQDYGYIYGGDRFSGAGFGNWDDAPLGMGYSRYLLEFGYPTDPLKADTDDDGYNDKIESDNGSDPNNNAATPLQTDQDNDGVNYFREIADGTNPTNATSFNPLSVGLIAYYPFDGSADDETGKGFNGTMPNGALATVDRFYNEDSAYYFNGIDQYVEYPKFGLTNARTFTGWVKFADTTDIGRPEVVIIGQMQTTGEFPLERWHFHVDPQSLAVFYHSLGFPDDNRPYGVLASARNHGWHHYAAIVEPNSANALKITMFLNGIEIGRVSSRAPNELDAPYQSMRLNGGNSLSDVYYYRGSLDDIRVYNRALSPIEVKQLYYQEGFNGEQRSFLFDNASVIGHYSQTEYDLNRTNGQVDVTTNPSAFNLFTQNEYESFGSLQFSNGIVSVISNPSAFNLFTEEEFNSNRMAGQSDVVSNPMTYGLYTSNSIMDLRMNGLMVQKNGSNAVVSFQTQTTTDLTQPFTNNGTPITNSIPMPGNKGFIRINAKP